MLSDATSSSSSSSWFTADRIGVFRSWERFWPIASTSSRNSTHGALRRATSKSSWMFRSERPTNMSIRSANDTVMNRAPSSPATARAMNVLPHPGGP